MTSIIVQGDISLSRVAFDAMVRYVDEHYAERITVADIAQAGTVSRTRAYEIFRERAGTSLADYLIEHRVMRAEELLATTDLPMADIAKRCGFSSPSHFARAYKSRAGQTPTEARERLRKRGLHLYSKHFEGIAPALTMQLAGMNYFPDDER